MYSISPYTCTYVQYFPLYVYVCTVIQNACSKLFVNVSEYHHVTNTHNATLFMYVHTCIQMVARVCVHGMLQYLNMCAGLP